MADRGATPSVARSSKWFAPYADGRTVVPVMNSDIASVPGRSERDEWLTIELRHLAALATVAQEASFSGAADSLGYVQSAISQQIGSLERIVGQRLVDRSARPRSVSVTPAGKTLLEHVYAILEQLSLAKEDIDALSEPSQPAVSFGVDALFGSWLTADLLGPLMATAARPAWDRIERASSRELLRLVTKGQLDAAFVPLPVASGPFFAVELRREAYVLAVPAATPAEEADAASILKRYPLVAIDDCGGTAALLTRRHG